MKKNNEENFFNKIRKMKTKLNLWLTRDLTLYGRTLLAKTIDVSPLIYTPSMLSVPETVVKNTKALLFNFLWKNENDKVKRDVIYQPLLEGGLNFPIFRIMVQSLRQSDTNDTWKAIPNYYFNKHGGLAFLLNCNYNTSKLTKNLRLFYRELLEYFSVVKTNSLQDANSKFILWNNQNITIDGNTFINCHNSMHLYNLTLRWFNDMHNMEIDLSGDQFVRYMFQKTVVFLI